MVVFPRLLRFCCLLWCLLDLEVYRFSLRSSCSKLSDRGERTTEQTLFPNTTEEHAMVTLSYTPLPAFLLSRVFSVSRVEGVLFRALCLRDRGRRYGRILAFFPVAIGCHLAAVLHVILHCHAHSENNLYSACLTCAMPCALGHCISIVYSFSEDT